MGLLNKLLQGLGFLVSWIRSWLAGRARAKMERQLHEAHEARTDRLTHLPSGELVQWLRDPERYYAEPAPGTVPDPGDPASP